MNYYGEYNPIANSKSIVQGDKYRFTVLTSRLIRVEYSESGVFEDRQTKLAINRDFPDVDYKVIDRKDSLEIVTEHVLLTYNKQGFENEGLSIRLRGNYSPYHSTWYYGDKPETLKGTARTLDFADGAVELDEGIMSKNGFGIIDDSETIILKDDGWYKVKEEKSIDIYYFGYGNEYQECLYDYYRLTGFPPKLPRYTLGNWWSRYYEYSEESYKKLLKSFEENGIPFTVAVIDMDWHLVDVPEEYGSGWTGYTWNKELFPDPERFLLWLKDNNYYVTLNVHPADGVRPFEEMYEDMAKELNIDYKNGEYITFDVTNKEFLRAYFEYLHHPNEKIGVDFWWVDWQQGSKSATDGIDPLWVLNHYHYIDANKDKNNITFSRYSGPGSHRYPVGFSGDTVVSWESLEFQPYFTSTASNIGYTWWSHDIGGHMFGYYDEELMTRWYQLGVFSPINRLHSSKSIFMGKEPMNFDEPHRTIMVEFLRLRHRLIPYLHSMNHLTHTKGLPLVRPMYYNGNGSVEETYEVPNQYYFGTELIVCPITEPINSESRNAQFKAWLPEGKWYDIFSGNEYEGNGKVVLNRRIDEYPVLAKAGAIIPLTPDEGLTNSVALPKEIEVHVFTGADNHFVLYEDCETNENKLVETHFILKGSKLEVYSKGDLDILPNGRVYRIIFRGSAVENVQINGNASADHIEISSLKEAVVTWEFKETEEQTKILTQIYDYIQRAYIPFEMKGKLWKIVNKTSSSSQKVFEVLALDLSEEVKSPVIELLGVRGGV